jgi:Domain of unknown function (DUF3846)
LLPVSHLGELQTLGGYIEILRTKDGHYMMVDEEDKPKNKPINQIATHLHRRGAYDPIVGTVVVCKFVELKGEEEEEEED